MPLYHYQCSHCQARETRIAGLDDHLAVCAFCRGLMLRLDLELFQPYFRPQPASQRHTEEDAVPRRRRKSCQ